MHSHKVISQISDRVKLLLFIVKGQIYFLVKMITKESVVDIKAATFNGSKGKKASNVLIFATGENFSDNQHPMFE